MVTSEKQVSNPSTALIVGASRGLGLGLVQEYLDRGWQVIATERRPGSSKALAALAQDTLTIEALDIDDEAAIAALAQRLAGRTLDLLYVNAGISDDPSVPIGQVATAEFERVMRTNALGPMRIVERLAERVLPQGTIAVMTSALGSVSTEPHAGYDLYSASKAALNRLMRGYAVRAGAERTLLAVMPGWVKTEMGGDAAPLDVKSSVHGIANAIAARSGTPGLTFIDYSNAVLPW
jgi:NAD(P)-dependent dehydrogenase (short-subunit alcohol dehydrogenase family)